MNPQKKKPLVGQTRGSVLPGEKGTRSGISIVARDGRLVKGGSFVVPHFWAKVVKGDVLLHGRLLEAAGNRRPR
ncbi:MAG: hypothetical protein ACETWB_05230 [Anaerolineae bacterium]